MKPPFSIYVLFHTRTCKGYADNGFDPYTTFKAAFLAREAACRGPRGIRSCRMIRFDNTGRETRPIA